MKIIWFLSVIFLRIEDEIYNSKPCGMIVHMEYHDAISVWDYSIDVHTLLLPKAIITVIRITSHVLSLSV